MTVGTFALPPGFGIVRRSYRPARGSTREQGHVRMREIREREVRRWTLRFDPAPDGFAEEARGYFDATRGALTLDWTPPGESSVEVRMVAPPSILWRGEYVVAVECELEEVL